MITKEILIEKYINENKGAIQTAKDLGVCRSTVDYWIKKYNIQRKPKGGANKIDDLTGKEFDYLKVISYVPNSSPPKWICKCKCTRIIKVSSKRLREHQRTSCGCKRWEGYEGISLSYWSKIKAGAKKRNIEFSINIQDIWDLYIRQDRRCALSGDILILEKRYYSPYIKNQTASLDRIDSSKGYTIDNVQWLHKDINIMKSNWSDEEFIQKCIKVVNHANRCINN
jgi:hypothetical protein